MVNIQEVEDMAEKYREKLRATGEEFDLGKIIHSIDEIRKKEGEEKHKETLAFYRALETSKMHLEGSLEERIVSHIDDGKDTKKKTAGDLQKRLDTNDISLDNRLKGPAVEEYLGLLFGLQRFGKGWYDTAIDQLQKGEDDYVKSALTVMQNVYLPGGDQGKEIFDEISRLISTGNITKGEANAWGKIRDVIVGGYKTRHINRLEEQLFGKDPEDHHKFVEYLSGVDKYRGLLKDEEEYDISTLMRNPKLAAMAYLEGPARFKDVFLKKKTEYVAPYDKAA